MIQSKIIHKKNNKNKKFYNRPCDVGKLSAFY